jgi:DNA-binding transcriptional ArsR family regulator
MGCKIDPIIERHSLTVPDPGYESVDEYLVARWTGADGRSSVGYKTLTEWFNKQLLKRLYEDHGRDTVSAHLDREYEIITGDEDLQRDELAADLATDDFDIDELATMLVSWSTMRHHLKDCLGAEKDMSSAKTDWESNTVQMARERAAEKAQSVLSSLHSKDRLRDADQAEVDVQVKLSCPACSVRVPFEDAVERGYVCNTHSETPSEEPKNARAQHQYSSLALASVVMGALEAVLSGEPFLLEAATIAAF